MDGYTEMTGCPMCGGQPALLGKLGNLTWLRCVNCGATFTAADTEPEYAGEENDDERYQ
jgi:transcription elongation factor Elf1